MESLGKVAGEEASPFLQAPWLRALVMHGSDLITLFDGQGMIRYVAPSLEHILGYQADELYGRSLTEFVHDADLPALRAHFAFLFANPGVPKALQFRIRHRGGAWRWHQSTGTNLLSDPNVHAVVMNQHDVTDQREAEEQLRESEQRFRALVESSEDCIELASSRGTIAYLSPATVRVFGYEPHEMTGRHVFELVHPDERDRLAVLWQRCLDNPGNGVRAEFRYLHATGEDRYLETTRVNHLATPGLRSIVTIYRDVSQRYALEEQVRQAQKMEAVGLLAGGIAHDFNNILSAISGFATIIAGEIPRHSPIQSDVAEITSAVQRAAALTRQLLAFGRRQVLQPQPFSVFVALRDMQQMLQRVIGEDIELRIDIDEDTPTARVDPAQFEQVMMNLVVNARDAMPRGGQLHIHARRTLVSTSEGPAAGLDLRPGEYVGVSVSDSGTGMTRELQERIFEPFFSTKVTGQGTGLGLATVFGIVKQSGGHIEVRSAPGEGTTFDILFPTSPERATNTSSALPEPSEQRRGTETILLVEDEPAVRSFVGRVLRQLGYKVLDASNGAEALLVAEQHKGRMHLLLTDVVMPRLSGQELAERLAPAWPDMAVLFMSGYAEEAIVKQGVLRPGSDFIEKPLNASGLARKVREILDRQPSQMKDVSPT
ncbi:MAG: PAS domain S-box protein [Deltaproteobacteria bacterium]|nr:PAS domain S-box protein [Deltaproteobacteria bacterium]